MSQRRMKSVYNYIIVVGLTKLQAFRTHAQAKSYTN